MPAIAVVGGQWGDEGKGKVIDLLATEAEMVIRAQGGDNAGHTVVNPRGEFVLHLAPAGIFNPDATCIIAPGVALNPAVLVREMEMLEQRGVSPKRLLVSDRAHMVLPYHPLLDRAEEHLRGDEAVGTTGRGIGPTYGDKVARVGLRIGDLLDRQGLERKLRSAVERANLFLRAMGSNEGVSLDDLIEEYRDLADRLSPYICDVSPVVASAVERGTQILLEGAQGTLLDIDHGSYPDVTSSACTVAGLCQGSGVPPRAISHALGVYKAYSTRVGAGPMPTELLDATGDYLREHAHEFGATTGRARRCGWFDGVVSRYTAAINGFDSIALTRFDMLDELPSIKICTAYRLDGKEVTSPPSDAALLSRCQPVYEELPGWQRDTAALSRFEDLPREAIRFIERVESLMRLPVALVGVGPERSQRIVRQRLWRPR